MNVFQNVAFGLKARKMPKAEMRDRVAQALELVQLAGLEKRPVTDLSGGQQQRVALARAIAVHPKILLLDEPLSNLDAELRYATRRQLAELQSRLKITAIYVTHDQEEALELAHRIAVMREGVVEQVGTPSEILDSPATPFVEAFLHRHRRLIKG
jgi:ABC-type Fe3+/spermidine/putrescine transport system ATPase subunit